MYSQMLDHCPFGSMVDSLPLTGPEPMAAQLNIPAEHTGSRDPNAVRMYSQMLDHCPFGSMVDSLPLTGPERMAVQLNIKLVS